MRIVMKTGYVDKMPKGVTQTYASGRAYNVSDALGKKLRDEGKCLLATDKNEAIPDPEPEPEPAPEPVEAPSTASPSADEQAASQDEDEDEPEADDSARPGLWDKLTGKEGK